MSELKDLVFGNVLTASGNSCAIDLIFRAESPSWIYFDDINGGVDPQFMQVGAGMALLLQNTQKPEGSTSERIRHYILFGGIFKRKGVQKAMV